VAVPITDWNAGEPTRRLAGKLLSLGSGPGHRGRPQLSALLRIRGRRPDCKLDHRASIASSAGNESNSLHANESGVIGSSVQLLVKDVYVRVVVGF